MLWRGLRLLAKANPSRKVRMADRARRNWDPDKDSKVRTRLARTEAAAAASHLHSIHKFVKLAAAIDRLTLGRTRALHLVHTVLKRDARTRLNDAVRADGVRLLEYRSGPLTPSFLSVADGLHLAQERGVDLVEVAASDRVSVCLLTAYRALILGDLEAHLYKEQLKAEGQYSRRRKVLPVLANVGEAEMRQKASQVVRFLTSRYSVQLQLIHPPLAWLVPLYSPTPVREDADLIVHQVSKVARSPQPLTDRRSAAAYNELEALEEQLRTLVAAELQDHPRNPTGLALTAGSPTRSGFLGHPLLLAEYALAAESKAAKRRRVKTTS